MNKCNIKINHEIRMTIISLAATIIILLILLVIAIKPTVEQDSITIIAQQESRETQKANLIKQIQIEIIESNIMEHYQIAEENMRALLEKYGTVVEEDGKIVALQTEDGIRIAITEIVGAKIVYAN